ncbi:MAG: thermonuclease family protein [Candidatus Omnitrophota bacterium]|nr:thermonuclease family protein [Candidatus Omnitrophota bacterium]
MFKNIRHILYIFISCIFLLNGGVASAYAGDGRYHVKKVIDGDTVELDKGERVRYIGVDTPEKMKKVKDVWIFDPEPYAIEAKEFNRRMLEGKEVQLEFDAEKTDKYGRLLAYVRTADGKMVNEELLKEGYARILSIPPNTKYAEKFLEIQKEAREAKRGIWSDR